MERLSSTSRAIRRADEESLRKSTGQEEGCGEAALPGLSARWVICGVARGHCVDSAVAQIVRPVVVGLSLARRGCRGCHGRHRGASRHCMARRKRHFCWSPPEHGAEDVPTTRETEELTRNECCRGLHKVTGSDNVRDL